MHSRVRTQVHKSARAKLCLSVCRICVGLFLYGNCYCHCPPQPETVFNAELLLLLLLLAGTSSSSLLPVFFSTQRAALANTQSVSAHTRDTECFDFLASSSFSCTSSASFLLSISRSSSFHKHNISVPMPCFPSTTCALSVSLCCTCTESYMFVFCIFMYATHFSFYFCMKCCYRFAFIRPK